MPLFKVTLEKIKPKYKNAFKVLSISDDDKTETILRTWKIKANNEKEIKQMLIEAQKQNILNVRGFHLHSIINLSD